jgi:hypothetical protein
MEMKSSISRPERSANGKEGPDDHWMGVWLGPKIVLDDVEKKLLLLSGIETQIPPP